MAERPVILEHRNGKLSSYWAARLPKLGIVGYGDTEDEAMDRAFGMAQMMLEHWRKTAKE